MAKQDNSTNSGHWIDRVAAQVEGHVRQSKGEGARIVCASGISPSGSIHLGNLRELMTVHLVCEELRARGNTVEHIHSWDDFDRFRKVPANVPESFAQYIGKPICDIPDPAGEYDSYASRHIAEFERSMDQLAIKPRYIRQSKEYRAGKYNEQIKVAMNKRLAIFDILSKYQTLEREGQESVESRREAYYPLRAYCAKCGTDNTKITAWDEATSTVSYTCGKCGHADSFALQGPINAKLVWKIDWPMRWVFEGVDFEPGGEDHAAPGSSFTVGKRIAPEIFGGKAPSFAEYSFVGMAGRTKISSSAGTNATPQVALDILEPCIVRWLYIRRQVKQKFDIDFGQQVVRLYDEWDAYCKNCESGKANEADRRSFERAIRSSDGIVGRTATPVSFRLLSSAADITSGNTKQILSVVNDEIRVSPSDPLLSREELEPRFSCALNWSQKYVPDDERTQVATQFDRELYSSLSEENRRGIEILLERLDQFWDTPDPSRNLGQLLYGVPKLALGHDMYSSATDEIKIRQREFFKALYLLMVKSETGPRLPTLFLSIGKERVKTLLSE